MKTDKYPILQYFDYYHLPEELQKVSKPFCELSHDLVYQLPDNPEKDVALRKLLEAKDAAIRSSITKGANNEQAKVSIADSERDGEGVHILPLPESEK